MFRHNDVLIIDQSWVLRNDKTYVVLYKVDASEARTWILPVYASYVFALINGENKYGAIISYANRIFDFKDPIQTRRFVDGVLNTSIAGEFVVRKREKDDRWNVFDSEKYFIPAENYRFPHHSRLTIPTKVNLFTTKICCADCIYCYADRSKDHPDELLSLKEWQGIIDESLKLQIWNLETLGGDQLADKTSLEIIKYLMSKNVTVFISTKCEITESMARELVSNGITGKPRGPPHHLQLSIDSVTPQIADQLTGTHGFFERVTHSARNCIKYGILPRVKCVLTTLNYMEIENIIAHFAAMGVKDFQFVLYGLSHFKPRPDLLLTEEQKKWVYDLYRSKIMPSCKDLRVTIQTEYSPREPSFQERMESWRKRVRCTGGYSSITVLPTGKAVLCEQMPQSPEYIVGDVREGGIMGVWLQGNIEGFLFPPKEKFLGTACFNCSEFESCHYEAGFCFRDALFAYDTVFEAPPKCPFQQKNGRRLV